MTKIPNRAISRGGAANNKNGYEISTHIIAYWDDGHKFLYNCVTKESIEFSKIVELSIDLANDPESIHSNVLRDNSICPEQIGNAIDALVELGILVPHGSKQLLEGWQWSLPSALFHFSAADCNFVDDDQAEQMQREYAKACDQPELFWGNSSFETVVELPEWDDELLKLMRKRRTCRDFSGEPIDLRQLGKTLFSGMGITGWTENCVGRLPLSMTPSGGARNPFEAYVLVKNVIGLEPGLYHYSAIENSLGLISLDLESEPSVLLGGQHWVDQASFIVFLIGHFERSMWKYRDNNAYRVVNIEAGHIAQNMMLAAVSENFAMSPTAALAHEKIKNMLNLDDMLISPIYALVAGKQYKTK